VGQAWLRQSADLPRRRGCISPDDTVSAVLAAASRDNGDRVFVSTPTDAWSFSEMDRRGQDVALALASRGALPGDRVAVMLPNSLEFLAIWFGITKLGAIEVSVNTAFKGAILEHVLRDSGASLVFIAPESRDELLKVWPHLPTLALGVIVGDSAEQSDPRLVPYPQFLAGGALGELPPGPSPLDTAVLGYTSGTSGLSKGAMIPHNRILKTAYDMSAIREIRSDDVLFSCLPLFHGNAKFLAMMPALVSGARVHLTGRFSASGFWQEIRRSGATQFNYLGVMISVLLKADASPDDRDHPLVLGWGAGARSADVAAFESRFGVELLEGYGLTETGIPASSLPGDRRPGSCGRPLPGYEIAVVDELDQRLGADMIGEIVVRANRPYTMMSGYIGSQAATIDAYRNCAFHTGDLGTIDGDGYLYFIDRKNDAIRRRGENISSFEVEALLLNHPAIAECAVVAVPSDVTEDDVLAIVVRKPGTAIDVAALVQYCRAEMPYFWVPRYIEITDETLPRTATNKVRKAALRERGITDRAVDVATVRE
jgi:crotonobetaine/carnitine-CoA ligase